MDQMTQMCYVKGVTFNDKPTEKAHLLYRAF